MKIKAFVISMTLLGALFIASPGLAATQYFVYCVKGKGAVVDTRTISKYTLDTRTKSGDVRLMAQFSNKKDAENFVKNSGNRNCK